MTLSDFWKIRVGDNLYDCMRERNLVVQKREICREILGYSLNSNPKKDKPIYGDFCYVQLTCFCSDGFTYFYDSMNLDFVRSLNYI